MPNAVLNTPSLPSPHGDAHDAAGLTSWLGGLLDMACDREDAPLARLIADVIDDLGGAARKG